MRWAAAVGERLALIFGPPGLNGVKMGQPPFRNLIPLHKDQPVRFSGLCKPVSSPPPGVSPAFDPLRRARGRTDHAAVHRPSSQPANTVAWRRAWAAP